MHALKGKLALGFVYLISADRLYLANSLQNPRAYLVRSIWDGAWESFKESLSLLMADLRVFFDHDGRFVYKEDEMHARRPYEGVG